MCERMPVCVRERGTVEKCGEVCVDGSAVWVLRKRKRIYSENIFGNTHVYI